MAAHTPNPYVDFYYGDRSHDFRPVSGYASDFHLYRVSSSKRYNDNLIPSLTDKTAEVPGADGMYFFNSYYKQKQFTVNIAFDKLNDADLREMRNWLNGKDIKDLIFDEFPDVAYKAKVTGTPNIKFVPFDEVTNKKTNNTTAVVPSEQPTRAAVYKGDGTITFTCYYPYGESINEYYANTEVGGEIPTTFVAKTTSSISANTTWTVSGTLNGRTSALLSVTFPQAVTCPTGGSIEWDSNTGLIVTKTSGGIVVAPVNFNGTSYGTIAPGYRVSINMGTLTYRRRYY